MIMSLLRLLSAGKSLVGIREATSRYHVTDQRLLPKFASKRNPFRATTRPEPAPAGSPASEPESAGAVDAGKPHVSARETLENRGGASGVVQGNVSGLTGKLINKLKGVLSHRKPESAKPAIPRFTKPLVQGELSLDRIKVVRNDLTDSDLEIVQARPPAVPVKRAPAGKPGAEVAMGEGAWNRVTERLFGASKP